MRAILTFHSIESSNSIVSFDRNLFAELLLRLEQKNIPVCELGALLASPDKEGVAITFDDGMKSVYRNALPVLRDHAAVAHLFLITGPAETGGVWPQQSTDIPPFEMLNWREVEELHGAGMRIESHTHTHPDMRTLTGAQAIDECSRSNELIESRLGRKPAYFAYPFGFHNRSVRDCVRGIYSGAVTTELRQLDADEDSAALPRLDAYYLRSRARVRHIDSTFLGLYLGVRNRLRTLKGSQCVRDQP